MNETKLINCTHQYSCIQPQSSAILVKVQNCGENAFCGSDINNNPMCSCNMGYLGDGFICMSKEI